MREFTEVDWLVALHHIGGVGWHTIDKINTCCGSFAHLPEQLIVHKERLNAFNLPWLKMREALQSSAIHKKVTGLKQSDIQVVTVLDEAYPTPLREIAQPPWVLYCLGDTSLLQDPSLAIVGTRHPSPYGSTVARKMALKLAKNGLTIVSGMAIGIDGEAHYGALEADGRTVAVLGSGVDVIYPKSHRNLYEKIKKNGVVISELTPGTTPHPGFFPQRNRIISGLSRGVLIVEAKEKSGSLITVDRGLEQNRDVFAIPGPITSPNSVGPLRLIKQGAKCVTSVNDILEEYPDIWSKPDGAGTNEQPETAQLTLDEVDVMACIEGEPIQLDQLAAASKRTLPELHPILLSLELKRLIKRLPGSQFMRQ